MKNFISKIKNRINNEKNKNLEAKYFKKYAKTAKKHSYKSKDIIMLRLDMIGDCTMFTSTAAAIRKFYKDSKMTILCLSTTKFVFESMGVFDRIITMDFKADNIDFQKLDELINVLRENEYDILLQPQASKLPAADIIAAAIKCNTRIAIETKPGNSKEDWINSVNFLYDKFIPYPRGDVSEFDYYKAFAVGLGIKDFKITCPCLTYKKQNFIEGKYFVLYPGGTFSQKFWPAEHYAKISNYIYKKTGLLVVLLGVAHEQWVADNVKKELNAVTAMSTIDLTGRTSIGDVIDIIGNAEFVISNDTSGAHIACAVKTPCVVIVGGWHYNRFFPYHIEDIKPDDKIPVVANTDMDCYHCDWNWDTIGKRNEGCLDRMKRGAPSECIERITYDQVRVLVDNVIDDLAVC